MINFTYCYLWRNYNKWTHWFLLSRAFVLSQKEIFINLQAKVVWKPGAIYDFLLRWACVQLYHMIIESTTRSSGSLQLRFILNCDVIFEFSFLNIWKMSICANCMYLIYVAQTSTFFDNEIESIECFEHWWFVSAEKWSIK